MAQLCCLVCPSQLCAITFLPSLPLSPPYRTVVTTAVTTHLGQLHQVGAQGGVLHNAAAQAEGLRQNRIIRDAHELRSKDDEG